MSSFAEKLAAAKAAPRPTADVRVLLASDLVAERDRLQAVIDSPVVDERFGAATPQDEAAAALEKLIETAGEAVVTLRFTQLRGTDWAELTSKCPPRPGVPVDERYAYNFDMVTLAAARFVDKDGRHYGHRVEDGELVELAPEDWADLIDDALNPHDLRNVRNTVWGLNEYLPQMQLEAMGKAFGATGSSANV